MVQNVSRLSLTVVGRFQSLANAICCEEKVALLTGFSTSISVSLSALSRQCYTHFHLSVPDRL